MLAADADSLLVAAVALSVAVAAPWDEISEVTGLAGGPWCYQIFYLSRSNAPPGMGPNTFELVKVGVQVNAIIPLPHGAGG